MSKNALLAGLCVGASFWLSCSLGLAADLPIASKPRPAPSQQNIFVQPDAACLAWTDGCRTCQRTANGDAACSNIGIACQPESVRCTQPLSPASPSN